MKSKFAIRQSIVSLLAVAAIGCPAIGLSDDTFQAEGGMTYSRSSSVGSRYEWIQGQATYYFDKLSISPKDYPLDQAQFVERIGSVSASYGQSSLTADYVKELRRGSMYGLAVDFRLPDKPLMAFASYGSSYDGKWGYPDTPYYTNGVGESSSESYELDVGAYLGKTTLLVLAESRGNSRFKFTSSLGTSESKTTSRTTGLTLQHLERFSNGSHAAFYAGISQTTTDNSPPSTKSSAFFLGGTYYPTKMVGLNFGIQVDNGDGKVGSSDDEIYSVGAKAFVTPTVSVSLDYLRARVKEHSSSTSDYSYGYHSLSLGASKRF